MSRMLHRTGLVPPRAHILLVVGVTFFALLVSAGLRATPGVLMVPLQLNFGWDRATISFAAGLVGTHMIAFCGDHGVVPVAAAGLLSMMGLFDLVGTTASGWLTDRYDPRLLLIVYYGLRGLSLMALPFLSFDATNLTVFAVFYGLDWIATVPPTMKLANQAFGEQTAPVVFGWILAGHQLGAAFAAFGAGVVRQQSGTYLPAFLGAGAMGVIAAGALLVSLRNARATTSLRAMS